MNYSIPDQELINKFYSNIKKSLLWIKKRNNSKPFIDLRNHVDSLASYKKEFCSISLSLPRRAGNTTLALKLFKSIKDSFLVFPTLSWLGDWRVQKLNRTRILSPQSMNKIRGFQGSVMIVDMASCLSEAQINKLYLSAVDYFILLG